MKIVSKTYLLISVLVAVAALNLFLLYQEGAGQFDESHSVLKIADIKVKAESVSGYAISVANGNLDDKENLDYEIANVESILNNVKNGGEFEGVALASPPTSEINTHFSHVITQWEDYRFKAENVKATSVFDEEATNAVNYVLQKNQDLVLLTDQLNSELD